MRRIQQMVILTGALVFGTVPAQAADKEDSLVKPYLGTWKGEMKQGNSKFPVAIRIQEFSPGKWAGEMLHEGASWGQLLAVDVSEKGMILSASIIEGRERTIDGLSILKVIDEKTIERTWINPVTGKGEAVGELKRVSPKEEALVMDRAKAKPTPYRYTNHGFVVPGPDYRGGRNPVTSGGSSRSAGAARDAAERAAREAAQDAIRDYQNTLRSRGLPPR